MSNEEYKTLADLVGTPMRMAAFCRAFDVTEDAASANLLWRHYLSICDRFPLWSFKGCYTQPKYASCDPRCLGDLSQLLLDCESGLVDIVLTKNVAALSLNLTECMSVLHQLSALKPPVGIFFENEQLFSLTLSPDVFVDFITAAEMESRNKNKNGGCRFGQSDYLRG